MNCTILMEGDDDDECVMMCLLPKSFAKSTTSYKTAVSHLFTFSIVQCTTSLSFCLIKLICYDARVIMRMTGGCLGGIHQRNCCIPWCTQLSRTSSSHSPARQSNCPHACNTRRIHRLMLLSLRRQEFRNSCKNTKKK